MSYPGVSIVESASSSLSVTATATALPVFVGQYKTADPAAALQAGKCIKVYDWLDFSNRFVGAGADVKFPKETMVKKKTVQTGTKKARNFENPVTVESVGDAKVRQGETFKCRITLSVNSIENNQLWLNLASDNNGYLPLSKKARLVFKSGQNSQEVELNETAQGFKLDVGTKDAELIFDTVFDEDDKEKTFSVKASIGNDQAGETPAEGKIVILPVKNSTVETKLYPSYFALQHYFQNGGGPCYLLPLLSGDVDELAALSTAIQTHAPDATLLVCAETEASLKFLKDKPEKSVIYDALNTLLEGQQGYFLVADSETSADEPGTHRSQTATYFPALQTFLKPQLADSQITLIGYADASGTEVLTLAALKPLNPKAYDYLVEKIPPTPAEFVILPASAAVAGCYARTDRDRGVWKAPANIKLQGVQAVTEVVTDADQSTMNEAGINAIRTFSERGTLVWGARTLDPAKDWCYVPVRRLFNSVERDIQQTMRSVVFEPNNHATWERVRSAIDNYLRKLWQQGALMGNSEAQAYYVQVGKDLTMSADDIAKGKLIVKVGMAAVRPAEFIVLQFSQTIQ